MENVLAVILGGGQGSRLYPLTRSRSKPAVPIGGKYRLVDIPISNCLNNNIRKIYVLTQFNSASLNRHIKNTYSFDPFNPGFVDVLAAEQTITSQNWFQGTADAVRQSIHHMDNHDFEYMMILSGDQLYQMDFKTMLAAHKASGAEVSIATIPVNADDATGFGIMKVAENGSIDSFVEKPSKEELGDWSSEVSDELRNEGKVYLASMGIYIFNRSVMKELFDEQPEAKDFGKEIIPAAIQNGRKVSSFVYDGYWEDIGTIKSFFEANLELTTAMPKFNLYDTANMVYTRARMLPASKISGTTLERTIVAEGSVIEASRIENSLIGIRSRIGRGTTVASSIVMGNDYFPRFDEIATKNASLPPVGIGERCFIQNCIIDKNSRIGNDVRINGGTHLEDGNYDQYSVVDGIVVVPKSSVIKDGTVI
ncbi:MAG: glucose-1-phosphate adenylyltransferase [Candidatus Cyclonatronum sp.]|uniref:glucose-1-phosphate adenylyltransferase n=1 Tax=Cyclonatronum sp. TaxID=3024185 RepID=UPI0025BCAC23|nr:glucose-1-phosphate adenylyltransferase [Cyclonatronum sp.]MCC5934815.1 glucose-1-phosphate adenylyltransferase [Balneolales bacterium]MCH8485379.1 glucose-1-phosphate adenylyltransferase [Cyclonatronum sp.]